MAQSSREIVTRGLKFEYPERMPRDIWLLPWASAHYKQAVEEIKRRFPSDFCSAENVYRPSPRAKGDEYEVGTYIDRWGCSFTNIHKGIVGEVKKPIIRDITDWRKAAPPYETLPEDFESARESVNRFCANTDKFVKPPCCPHPWERYQFLRGTENALMDVMMPDEGLRDLLQLIHEFYLKELEFWVSTDVDAVMFMDDWGSQNQLLIPPGIWHEFFRPLYKDYCDLAHSQGKFAFMHSDGNISEIYEDLVEVGVDAINSQLFCMDMADLAKRIKGRITFWGEIDRQHVLTSCDPQVGRNAVQKVAEHLYDPAGGIIAQFEFGPGVNPDTAIAIFEQWQKIQQSKQAK
jgi:hypothetical protein